MTVNLHVTILIKEEHPHTPFLALSWSHWPPVYFNLGSYPKFRQ